MSLPAMIARRLTLHALLVSVSATAMAAIAQAQEVVPADMTILDELTVMGTRTAMPVFENPRTVGVVRQEEIARRSSDGIAELLRDMPGVEVADESVAGMKRIRIRGESSRRVTILVDGQEITDHSTYGTPLLIEPSMVERIEVVRGPSSVLFGAKAIGGVVNIVTKRGAAKPIQVEAGGSLFSATRGRQGSLAASGTIGDFDYRLSASADKHEDRRVPRSNWAPTGKLDNTAFRNETLYGHLGYRFGENKNHYLSLKAERHHLSSKGWSGVAIPGQEFSIDLPKRERRKIGLFYDAQDVTPLIARIHADAYYQTIDRLFANRVKVNTTPTRSVAVVSTSDDTIRDIGAGAQIDLKPHRDHYLIVGVQALSDRLDTAKGSTTTMTGFAPRPVTIISTSRDKAKIDTFSVYAQDEWTLPYHFKLTGGARLYHTRASLDASSTAAAVGNPSDKTDTALVKSLGLTWGGLRDTVLRASYSEGFITPTLLQRYSSTTAGGQGITYGNPALNNETSRNIEIGARYMSGGLVLDAAAFYTRARDYITTQRCAMVGGACLTASTPASAASYYVNADRATTYGFEALAEYTIAGSGFTPYASGALIRRQIDYGAFKTYNSDTPLFSGRLGLRYETTWHAALIWADLYVRAATGAKQTYMGTTGLVTDSAPQWATLNLAAGTKFGPEDRYTVGIAVNNIFNRAYRPTLGELPAVGRSVELTAKVTF